MPPRIQPILLQAILTEQQLRRLPLRQRRHPLPVLVQPRRQVHGEEAGWGGRGRGRDGGGVTRGSWEVEGGGWARGRVRSPLQLAPARAHAPRVGLLHLAPQVHVLAGQAEV